MAMTSSEILVLLEKTNGPSRFIDKEIALLQGWKRRVDKDGKPEWFRGETDRGMPFYTRSIQAAAQLAYEISPQSAVACAWFTTHGTAVIDDGEPCKSANTPLALCLACMRILNGKGTADLNN